MTKYKRLMSLGMISLARGGVCRMHALHGVISAGAMDALQGFFIGASIALNLLAARHRCLPARMETN